MRGLDHEGRRIRPEAQHLAGAVGAAVIGGTSLFGGRGKVMDAVIGGLVIAVIAILAALLLPALASAALSSVTQLFSK